MAGAALARRVFITGGTGYVGRRLIPELLRRGHAVRAMARRSSVGGLPAGCEALIGGVFDRIALEEAVAGYGTIIQLVGVSKPAPGRARNSRR